MNAEQVVEKILSEANAEAEKINAEAKEKLAFEQEGLRRKLGEYHDESRRLAHDAAEQKKLRLLAATRMKLGKEYLATKRQLLEEVFAAAGRKLRELDDEEYRELMSKLMVKAIQTGDEEVIIGNNETRIDHSFIKHVNHQLGTGYKGNLRLSEQREGLDGGFILRRGKIKTNVSVEVLLGQAKENLEIELAKELFN